jgi:hypothetical protein
MLEKFEQFWTLPRRRWLYQVSRVALPLCVLWGAFSQDTASLVAVIIATALSMGSDTSALKNPTPDFK